MNVNQMKTDDNENNTRECKVCNHANNEVVQFIFHTTEALNQGLALKEAS